nr:hypothetical protein [Malassezia furfur]WBU10926.1 hypothetical protein [Malassezia furfur]
MFFYVLSCSFMFFHVLFASSILEEKEIERYWKKWKRKNWRKKANVKLEYCIGILPFHTLPALLFILHFQLHILFLLIPNTKYFLILIQTIPILYNTFFLTIILIISYNIWNTQYQYSDNILIYIPSYFLPYLIPTTSYPRILSISLFILSYF